MMWEKHDIIIQRLKHIEYKPNSVVADIKPQQLNTPGHKRATKIRQPYVVMAIPWQCTLSALCSPIMRKITKVYPWNTFYPSDFWFKNIHMQKCENNINNDAQRSAAQLFIALFYIYAITLHIIKWNELLYDVVVVVVMVVVPYAYNICVCSCARVSNKKLLLFEE